VPGGGAARAPARAGVLDALRLGVRLAANTLRGKHADAGLAVCEWARNLTKRDGGVDVDIAVPGRTLELITDPDSSERVLGGRPGFEGYKAGQLKTSAMAFLAPGALTIANGDAWLLLRPFNEHVLETGHPHQFAQTILEHVRAAFARPVRDIEAVRAAMGRAMVKIVVGDVPKGQPDPAADVTALFAAVQSPIRRKLFGFSYRGRRERLYALLGRKWEEAGDGGGEQALVALGRRLAPDVERTVLLQQIPHWMFTFTGSGTDLVARTLAMVSSRADVQARVVEEIGSAGPGDRAETVARLPYLEACLLETGRLFPPVTRTFHAGPGDREIVHYFPILQRDDRLGSGVHAFRPERWLAAERDPAAAASNLFLRGPRACPGMDLILFVCKAAAARQLGELGLSARQDRLTRDPLPISFPKWEAPFGVVAAGEPAR
jgi:Cytochrome P450